MKTSRFLLGMVLKGVVMLESKFSFGETIPEMLRKTVSTISYLKA